MKLTNRNLTLHTPPPPASGSVLSMILGILDGYKLNPTNLNSRTGQILTYHRITEAFKFAFGKRSALGDEDFIDVQGLVNNMTCSNFVESIRLKIDDDKTHDIFYYEPAFEGFDDDGTSHISILGKNQQHSCHICLSFLPPVFCVSPLLK